MLSFQQWETARKIALAAALSAAIPLSLAGCRSTRRSSPPDATPNTKPRAAADAIGEAAHRVPAFSVKDLRGQEISPATLKGKVALLDFWATWRPPCRKEIPHFNRLYAKYRDQGLVIIGLALDENAADVAAPDERSNDSSPREKRTIMGRER